MSRIVSLIHSIILTATFSSVHASHLHDIDAVRGFLKDCPHYTSLPASRLFTTTYKHTAAGVFHYAHDESGAPVVLLGLRDDNGTYCNLGGMSNEDEVQELDAPLMQSLLSKTASREVMEESNGYYAHHPSDLERQPFIDVLTEQPLKGALLYRMYMKKVKKVDAAILLQASKEAHHSHNQEFLEFIWVPVEEIVGAVKKNCNTFLLGDDKSVSLFEPLFATLCTPSGIAFLNAIHTKGMISFFDKGLRALHNRLYVVQENAENHTSLGSQVHWVLPEMRLEKPVAELHYLDTLTPEGKRHTLRTYVVPTIAFGQNAWGQTSQVVRFNDLPFTTNLSAALDHKIFCDAVAAHGAAMVELKHKFPQTVELPQLTESAKWDANSPLTITRIHLRIVCNRQFNPIFFSYLK